MAYRIESHCLQVGQVNSYDKALGLENSQRIEPDLLQINNQQLLALPITNLDNDDYLLRLSNVLKAAMKTVEVDWLSAPVLVLLPQLGTVDQAKHQALYPYLCQAIPALSSHPHCYLYPYGRSALTLAWQQIDRLLDQPQHTSVWVLALDSDPRLSSLLSDSVTNSEPDVAPDDHGGIVAVESVIAVKISTATTGLVRPWLSYEALTREKALNVAVSALFQRYQQACGQAIYQFYAPYDGEQGCAEEWSNAYHQLHGCVGKYTKIVMSGSVIGELGACSGLYNLLHLYERYQQGEYRQATLQLEISEKLYRGAALYGWQP